MKTTPTNLIAKLLATLIDLFLPIQCAGCGTPGQPLCIRCAATFDGPFAVHRPSTATGPPIHALATYRDTARTIILCFKERGRRDLARPLGRMIAAVLPILDTPTEIQRTTNQPQPTTTDRTTTTRTTTTRTTTARTDAAAPTAAPSTAAAPTAAPTTAAATTAAPTTTAPITAARTWWLIPAPSTAKAARRRGGSHTLALAREAAAALADHGHHAAVAPALTLHRTARDSAGLAAQERHANLTGRVKFHSPGAPPRGTTVILLDDIVTTGATATACTEVLADAGIDVTAVLCLTAV